MIPAFIITLRNQALWEAVLALIAAALVGSLVVYMWRAGKRMKRRLWSRYGQRVNLARFFQVTAVFLVVFVVQLVI